MRNHWLYLKVTIFVIIAVAAILNFPAYSETRDQSFTEIRDHCGMYLEDFHFEPRLVPTQAGLLELDQLVLEVVTPVPDSAFATMAAINGVSELMSKMQVNLHVAQEAADLEKIETLKDNHFQLARIAVGLNYRLARYLKREVLN